MTELLRFDDITPIEEIVSVGGQDYILREASGEASVKYDNAFSACREYKDGKVVRVNNPADLEPLLVSLCLFIADGKTPVSQETIRAWPGRVQRALFSRACDISGYSSPPRAIEQQIVDAESRLAELRKALEESKQAEGRAKN